MRQDGIVSKLKFTRGSFTPTDLKFLVCSIKVSNDIPLLNILRYPTCPVNLVSLHASWAATVVSLSSLKPYVEVFAAWACRQTLRTNNKKGSAYV